MPDDRLSRARESLPEGYQFGHGKHPVRLCSECGQYGHAYCATLRSEREAESPNDSMDWFTDPLIGPLGAQA